jgi:hypothetical protein
MSSTANAAKSQVQRDKAGLAPGSRAATRNGAPEKNDAGESTESPVDAEQTASIFCYPPTLPKLFVQNVRKLEAILGQEVWLLLQGRKDAQNMPLARIDSNLLGEFVKRKAELPQPVQSPDFKKPRPRLALLIDSYGGYAEPAYRLSNLLKRRCGGFTAVVPRIATSAATLFCLGADSILLGEEAELGPLDTQFFDSDVEEDWVSALDEVQAVEALEQSATEAAFKVMVYLAERTGKSFNVLMAPALHFAAEITKPLFDKIDAVRYTRQSRMLQEAQDYAERLLRGKFSESQAKAIARDLVRNYPTHGFVIDREEAQCVGKTDGQSPIGLQIGPISKELNEVLEWFYGNTGTICAIGRLQPRQTKGPL